MRRGLRRRVAAQHARARRHRRAAAARPAGSASGWSAAGRPGRCETSRNSVSGGGSSRILSSALADDWIAVVDRVDDRDAVPGPAARHVQFLDEAAHLVDADGGVEPLAGVARRFAQHAAGWDSRPPRPARRHARRFSSPVRAKTSRATSKASVALPMPRGPCSRMPPGSRAASSCRHDRGARRVVPDDTSPRSRAAARRRAGRARAARRRRSRGLLDGELGEAAGDASQISCSSASSLWLAGMTTQRSGLLRAMSRKASRSRGASRGLPSRSGRRSSASAASSSRAWTRRKAASGSMSSTIVRSGRGR